MNTAIHMFFRRNGTDPEKARLSLQKGITALVSMQQTDGSFPVLQRIPGNPWHTCHPLFSTLSVLLAADTLLPGKVLSKAVTFVQHCRRNDGTWEFDPDFGIPADADDTACALAVLARYDKTLVAPTDAAVLRSFWRPDGGPFQTWQAKEGEWYTRDHDDAVVNCNVLLALRELGIPASTEEINAVVHLTQKTKIRTRYYCSPTTIAYAACRAGLPLDHLPARLVARPKRKNTILPTAQWLSIVRQWDEGAVAHLLAAQIKDGHWPTEAWFTGIANPTPVWGSAAISTALCLEALQYAVRAT